MATNMDKPRYSSIAGWYARPDGDGELTYWDGKAWKLDGPETPGAAPGSSSADGHESSFSGARIALIVLFVILGLILVGCVAVIGTIGGLMNQGL